MKRTMNDVMNAMTAGATTKAEGAAGGTRNMPEEDRHRDPVQDALKLAAEVVRAQEETIEHLIRCLCRKCHCRCHEDDDDHGDRDRRRDRDER